MHDTQHINNDHSERPDVRSNEVCRVNQIEYGHHHAHPTELVTCELCAHESPTLGDEQAHADEECVENCHNGDLDQLEITYRFLFVRDPGARLPEDVVDEVVDDEEDGEGE